jgi:hypothetical protein
MNPKTLNCWTLHQHERVSSSSYSLTNETQYRLKPVRTYPIVMPCILNSSGLCHVLVLWPFFLYQLVHFWCIDFCTFINKKYCLQLKKIIIEYYNYYFGCCHSYLGRHNVLYMSLASKTHKWKINWVDNAEMLSFEFLITYSFTRVVQVCKYDVI